MHPSRNLTRTGVLGVALAVVTGLLGAPLASAYSPAQATAVSAVPQLNTPVIHDGAVYAVAQVGSTIVVGGSFTTTESAADPTVLVPTPYVLAFDATTGALQSSFRPTLTGGSPGTTVQTLLPGPTPGTVYVGGVFTGVNGAAVKGLTLLDVSDGSQVTTFRPPTMDLANVQSVKRLGTRLYVGGAFTTVGGVRHGGLATLDASTGALDPYLSSSVTVNHSWTTASPTGSAKAAVGVSRLDVSPDGTKLVAIGNFKQVDGVLHDQVAMWDLTASTGATVRPWNTSRYQALCNTNAYDSYVRDVSFSPDGSYFVVSATGGYGPAGSLCDAATRWETGATGTDVPYTWVDYTGKDTLLSVAITGTAVYVGGHERWMNNPVGTDSAGPGAVPRPGVAALDPDTGLPLAWNPGRAPRGAGTWTLYATSAGLWMGSDTDYVGNYRYKRGKLAFFPLAGGAAVAGKAVPALPGDVVTGTVPAAAATGILTRVNAGGPLLRSIDAGPDWAADNGTAVLHNTGSTVTTYATPVATVGATVAAGTPSAVFSTERYDAGVKGDGGEMQWHLPGIPAGTQVDVRLYFANRASATQGAGKRTFDVSIDGTQVLSAYDIAAAAGDQTGTMRSVTVTSDGTVDVSFTHEVNNPVLSAIEVVRTGTGATPLPAGSLSRRTFTGTTASAPTPVAGLDPTQVHGAMVVGGQLFSIANDGNLYRRSTTGGTLGSPVLVDPYNDPAWADVQTGSGQTYRGTKPNFFTRSTNVTSLSFDGVGRIYYTLYGTTALYSRTFSPDSGVMGTEESTVAGTLPKDVTGAFLSGGRLWFATGNGTLWSQAFGGPAGLSGVATAVPGTGPGGTSWAGPVLYLAAQGQPPVAAASVRCVDLRCTADGGASRDPDGGTITSYAWSWGDGTTGTGATATHDYAAPGTYPVVLTVTNSAGSTASSPTQYATASAHVNTAPTGAFTASCTLQACTFDGSTSSDADGTVTGWAWTYGDGATGSGSSVQHTYAAGGSYPVTLTVTDDAGATSTVSRTVTVQQQPVSGIVFRGSSSTTSASATTLKLALPAGTQVGDALLLKVDLTGTGNPTAPAGWAELDRASFAQAGALQVLWQKVATAADLTTGSATLTLAVSAKSTAQLLAYGGTAATGPASAVSAVDTALTATHTAPATTVGTDGSLVLWSWADKSSTTTGWTLPTGVTTRGTGTGTGTGFLTTALGDSGAWPAGQVPAQTATTSPSGTATRGVMTTIVLAPAG